MVLCCGWLGRSVGVQMPEGPRGPTSDFGASARSEDGSDGSDADRIHRRIPSWHWTRAVSIEAIARVLQGGSVAAEWCFDMPLYLSSEARSSPEAGKRALCLLLTFRHTHRTGRTGNRIPHLGAVGLFTLVSLPCAEMHLNAKTRSNPGRCCGRKHVGIVAPSPVGWWPVGVPSPDRTPFSAAPCARAEPQPRDGIRRGV